MDAQIRDVDVIVLGAGPVGENVGQYAAEAYARGPEGDGSGGSDRLEVVLVEGELVGGECSYWACMPSKALLRPVDVAATTRDLAGVSDARVEPEALLRRRDEYVSDYDDASQVEWADGAGLEVVRGHGRIVGEREVEVASGGQSGAPVRLRARHAVVLATGSEPSVPDLFDGVAPWGSRDATGVREVPGRLLIVGGGVVACEAATWFAALGAEVTLLVRGDGLLSGFEPFAGQIVADSLRAAGVDVRLGVDVTDAQRQDPRDGGTGRVHGGRVTLKTSEGDVTGDEVLLATGRTPRLGDVGLDAVGLSPDDVTEGRLPAWLHAVGDASGEAPLTHWGKYRAREIGTRIGDAARGRTDAPSAGQETPDASAPVPQVVFTDPQVASVGMTQAEATGAGRDIVTSEVELAGVAGAALLRDSVTGRASLVVDRADGRVLGATFVGHEAGELLHAATIAIVGQVPVRVLRHAVPSYPTASEVWLRLLEQLPVELR